MMTIWSKGELQRLAAEQGTWCASIYMPAYPAGAEMKQDSIRLKKLLAEAERLLVDGGLRSPKAREILEPARALIPNQDFWQRQSQGLALFCSPNGFYHYQLPFEFKELVVVAQRFHLKPLIQIYRSGHRFFVLAISRKKVKLFEGTQYKLAEVDMERFPPKLADELQYEATEMEKELTFHAATPGAGSRAKRSALFRGHGIRLEDIKTNTREYFNRVDEAMYEMLTQLQMPNEESPLVIAGIDYLHPIYWDANTYPNLMDDGIKGNPWLMTPEELHKKAWVIVSPYLANEQEKSAALYRKLKAKGEGLAAKDMKEIVLAAYLGRVRTLFVALDKKQWGSFSPDLRRVEVHEKEMPGDEDLLDFAAVHTLMKGGNVYVAESDKIPSGEPLAAIYRY